MARTTPYDDFQDAASIAKSRWTSELNNPFAAAYERAKNGYLETLERQEDADRAKAELQAQLMMLALSLTGGSILTVFFGKSSAKLVSADLVKDQLLNTTVNRGWDRAFTALAWTDGNATAKFVLGKLWDEAGSKITKEVSNSMKAVPQGAKAVTLGSIASIKKGPVEFQAGLSSFTERWFQSVLTTGKWLNNDFGGERH